MISSFARKISGPKFFRSISQRNLLTVRALKVAQNAFKHAADAKHFTLYHGAVYGSHMTGILERLYDLAVYDSSQGQASATNRLILALFHKFKTDDPLQPTQNMSLPGWSLTPEILADILASLQGGTFDSVREKIAEKWRAAHKNATQKKLTEIKVNEVLDLIAASHKECLEAQQPTGMTVGILLAFLFRRAENTSELKEYYQRLKASGIALDLSPIEAEDFQINTGSDENDLLYEFRHQPEKDKESYLQNHSENIYSILLADHHTLPPVETQHYGYQGQLKRPDCFESMLHNLLNILLFDNEAGRFDFTKLPKTLQPEAELIALYANESYQVFQLNTPQNGQAFFDLMSEREGLEYGQEGYEILGHLPNFITSINSLFGIRAETMEDLSHAFSDARRSVTFSVRIEGATTVITVTLKDTLHQKEDSVTLKMNQGHCTIHSGLLGYSGSTRIERIFCSLSRGPEEDMARDPLLFSLYASTRQYYLPLLVPRQPYFSHSQIDEIQRLQQIALCIKPDTHAEACILIESLRKVCETTPNAFLENVLGFLRRKYSEEETKEATASFRSSP